MKIFTLSAQAIPPVTLKNSLRFLLMICWMILFVIPASSREANNRHPLTVVITQQPVSVSVCENQNALFSVTANGAGALNYRWQLSTDNGATWNDLSNNAIYSGVATASLQLNSIGFSMNSNQYRCVVSDGSSIFSSAATLTVSSAPTVQTANIAVQVCINGSATITASAYAGLSYQWQVNTGSGFVNVVNGGIYAGAATSMLNITGVPSSMEGYLYRYIASNTTTGCSAISGIDTLHVLPYASITQQPVNTTTCPGSDAIISVDATGASSIKWQVSTNGSTWSDVSDNALYSGAATSSLQINNAPVSMNNYRYRAVLYNALSCPVSSNAIFLFVRPVTAITVQPVSTTVCATNTATFRVTATGSTLTYQWQTDNGTNGTAWSNISPGGTSSTLNRSNVSMSMNGHRFRVIVNGYCGSVTSASAVLQTKNGTWLGVTSTDWHTASNWCGGVPDVSTDVLIPAGVPHMPDIISGTGYSKSIEIESGARLTVSGGLTQMTGPFVIEGTVAYTGPSDQQVLPASHGSLEIAGAGNKYLQTSTDVYNNLVLNGSAKLVTSAFILTMKAGSNPISGTDLANSSTSWIVTGNGNTGAANTGTGGLKYEEIRPQDGQVIFPVGPTGQAYNPLFLSNKGVRDYFTVAVNDQPIPGSFIGRTINRTWKVVEGVNGGSRVSLDLKWNKPEEQPQFDSASVLMVRSAGEELVETRGVKSSPGRPFARESADDFMMMTAFSLHSFDGVGVVYLPVKLKSFTAKKQNTSVQLNWSVEDETTAAEYILQKSSFGDRGFRNIAQIKAAGREGHYDFTDLQKSEDASYYRLEIREQNKRVLYSQVIKTEGNSASNSFLLRPSITSASSTRLVLSLPASQKLMISLVNSIGQLQWSKTSELQAGDHSIPLDLSTISPGMYFIRIEGKPGVFKQLPLIKQ